MKQKRILILINMLIILSVRCSSPVPLSPIPVNLTPRIDATVTVVPTVQLVPVATATATRTAVPIASPSRALAPIASPVPTQGGGKDMSGTPLSASPDLENQGVVRQAKEDLAKRLSISIDQISLAEFESVTWSDGSLGCPQPGMMYTQALVDGQLIRLNVRDQIYEYHSGGNRAPFLCQSKP